ncbi:MBL fold metallo-hydrolase [Williamsia phyllosphaerae]|uniref:MBL fold metallo-hydrolase n=1 Tax=Williamsia phyllosphaerae TaxID=885042 RepID=A0ABQ1UEV7_9NOCA|nr:MBL fold metallo-hydrolase [Williamsia phyllosphaerae]GGF14610.1 MBL fold metallo-hydrolase [Williamsia phyllosphaerae]
MRLTKHTHATVSLHRDGRTLLIDPGTFTPDALELARDADVILVTHDHFDHFDRDAVLAALDADPELELYGPSAVIESLDGFDDRTHVVTPGDEFTAAGFAVVAYGGEHALIHPEIPQIDNIGYLVDGSVLHPGDAYLQVDAPVDTLLVPTSGPWTKMSDAIDYVRAVRPRQSVQIHDVMLSDVGTASATMFLGEQGLTGTTLLTLTVGESVTI